MEKGHLLICGERGAGKSSLIAKLLSAAEVNVGGFVTKRESVADENGFYPIYIHPAAQARDKWQYGKENLLGICDSHSSVCHREVFDTLGVQQLQSGGDVILMDELGFLENEALAFQKAVLDALDGDTPVIAAVKSKETDFLNAVRTHPSAKLVYLDADNREMLFEELLPWFIALIREAKVST